MSRTSDGKFGPGNEHAFKPGQCGNPAGRPKSKPLTDRIRALLHDGEANDDETTADRIAAKIVELAEAGDLAALRLLLDRIEGRVPATRAEATREPAYKLIAADVMEAV